jgi:transcriptional regulator with XRE-family HTH domain
LEERVQDLGAFIRGQREIAQLSLRRLAELAGVSNPYLSQIERGLRHPSAEILQQIAKGLRVSAESLYVRAGILDDEREASASVIEAIQRDAGLTPGQKQTLVTVYESFRAQNGRPAGPMAAGPPAVDEPDGQTVAPGSSTGAVA